MNNAAPMRAVAAVAGEQLLDAVHDQRPVRQPGQRVVQRLMAQLAGPLTDQPQRACPTSAQHQNERGEHETGETPISRTVSDRSEFRCATELAVSTDPIDATAEHDTGQHHCHPDVCSLLARRSSRSCAARLQV